MVLNSMTGFARADGEHNGARWHWEARTVNGRGLDIRLRLPSGMERLEVKLRSICARHIRRGNCSISLNIRRAEEGARLKLNEQALGDVLAAAEQIRQTVSCGPLSLDGLLSMRGVLEAVEADDDSEDTEQLDAALVASFESLVGDLAQARLGEGTRLCNIVCGHIDTIERLTREAACVPERKPEAIAEKLRRQVAGLLDASGEFDADRLHQEAVMLATRQDIQEEIDRLHAHVGAARDLLSSNEAVGRKLDFLTQEFNREANTICSKANSNELSRIGLELKAVIDQLREQVQNVE